MSDSLRRKKVFEHRVTINRGSLQFRWWIETDPEYGGTKNFSEAASAARDAVDEVLRSRADLPWTSGEDSLIKESCLERLAALVPGTNSIEVTYSNSGHGLCLHVDWP